ncbi:MAG: aminoacyl-histidine dipeptidase [Lachnospiraceae bacterium]|nr:aminoacyl-histidine dipeptidase [Lachnospiraceae bacterium]
MGVIYQPDKALFWKYFEEMCAIPHGSGNITAISNYLVDFARKHELKYVQDEVGNVVIYKDASEGYENEPGVIIQGHMDMVAVKDDDCSLDLTKDGLKLVIDGDWLTAEGTSLGGDDGIAVAYALAILADKEAKHPYLEVVVTVDEEVGMDGAIALDGSLLKARRMLNIDNEGEGILLTSCAGGSKIECSIPVERKERTANVYELSVSGLKGGHSGIMIHDHRVSAAVILARYLCELKTVRTRIIDIQCGTKDNAIADSGYMKFICSAPLPDVCETVQFYTDVLKEELASKEPDFEVKFNCVGQGMPVNALHKADSDRIMDFFLALPQGVDTMSADIPGLVETSDNIGVVKLNENEFNVTVSVRSSFASAKQALCDKIIAIATLAGGTSTQSGDYPGWAFRKDSPLRDKMVEIYKEMTGKDAKIEAVHAGVECGIFAEKLPGLDCVSFGPDMEDIHTTKERLSISSSERVFEYVVRILASK